MKVEFINSNTVRAFCPDCQAVSSFSLYDAGNNKHHSAFSRKLTPEEITLVGKDQNGIDYAILTQFACSCGGCHRGAVVEYYTNNNSFKKIKTFYPQQIKHEILPVFTPAEIKSEFQEAEKCMANDSFRAASAMFRSTLEKVLKLNGYRKGKDGEEDKMTLKRKISIAADEGVLHPSRAKKAHEHIRVLGNDVLHDDWQEVSREDIDIAKKYAKWIIDDLYDDRETIEEILTEKKRKFVSVKVATETE